MANVGTGAAGKTLIGAGNGASPTYASIGTNSGLGAHGAVIAEGNGAFVSVVPGSVGQVLTSNGPTLDPSFKTAADLHTARYIVSAGGAADGANYTTIASAISAASSAGGNQTIFIQPGSYTENLTLLPNINLTAFNCDATTPNVTIVGKCSFSSAGTVSLSGIRLQTNSDFALAITGSAASSVFLNSCYINCANNTGISFTTANTSAALKIINCVFNLATTGIAYYSSSTTGGFNLINCLMLNTGGSSTASSNSAGSGNLFSCIVSAPLSTSSGGVLQMEYCNVNCAALNTSALTLAGTGTSNAVYSDYLSGSASAISIGSGTTLQCVAAISANSTNTNAITGGGTLLYTFITYPGSSRTNNVTTLTQYNSQTGAGGAPQSWTPALNFGGATTGITYGVQTGTYVQIGKVVHFILNITLSSKGALTGTATITGWPLPISLAGSTPVIKVDSFTAITLDATYTQIEIQGSSSTAMQLTEFGSGATISAMSNTQFSNTSGFNVTGYYFTT